MIRSLSASNIRFTIDGIEYEWTGGFGEIMSSREHGIRTGTTRVIGTVLFYAWRVEWALFRGPKVSWSIINPDAETIRAIKEAIFR